MYQQYQNLFNSVSSSFSGNPDILNNIIATLAILVLMIICRRILLFIVHRQSLKDESEYMATKVINYTIPIISMIIIARTWFSGVHSAATFLGLFSAGLAIAMKDMIANTVGWIYLLSRHHFQLGDRIEIEETYGDVIDIGIQSFTVMEIRNWVDADQSTGRLIEIPLSTLLTKPIANYSKGFPYIWHEIDITVTFESNWEKAKSLLEAILSDYNEPHRDKIAAAMKIARRNTMVSYNKLTPAVYTSITENGVRLTLRLMCNIRQRRGANQDITETLLKTFKSHDDIHFAYPTQRVYWNKQDHTQPAYK